MNAENYPDFLRQPERLWQLNGHELRSLVIEYPYSANLRLLLAQKAKMEDWPDADALLALAATYHSDRKQLHWQMQMLPTQRPEDTPQTIEEVLELKPLRNPLPDIPELSELERMPSAAAEPRFNALVVPGASSAPPPVPPVEVEPEEELVWPVALPEEEPTERVAINWDEQLAHAMAVAGALPLSANEEVPEPELAALVVRPTVAWSDQFDTAMRTAAALPPSVEKTSGAATITPRTARFELDDTIIAGVASGVAAADGLSFAAPQTPAALAPEEVIAPLPVEVLPSYKEQFRPARLSTLSELLEAKTAPTNKPKKKKKAKRRKTKEVARRSLETDAELGSETLAQLLETQGHYERAQAMYERLRLSNPEKSGFFAARIQALQALIDRLPPA